MLYSEIFIKIEPITCLLEAIYHVAYVIAYLEDLL